MDFEESERIRLRKLIEEELTEHGVSFDNPIPDSPGRQAYLHFLADMGEQERSVLPIMDLSRITREMYQNSFAVLQHELDRTRGKLNPKSFLAMFLANSVREVSNTNHLIQSISLAITGGLKKRGIVLPDFYAAVYPTNTYNGETRRFYNQNIVLLHTGLFETIEVIVTALLSKSDTARKARDITEAVRVLTEERLAPNDSLVSIEGIDWSENPAGMLLNGAESFILLHEIGHIELGHVTGDPITRSPHKMSRKEYRQAWHQEYQADAWAFNALSLLGRNVREYVTTEEQQTKRSLSLLFKGVGGVVGGRLSETMDLFGVWRNTKRQQKDYLEWMTGPTIGFGLGALIEKAQPRSQRDRMRDHPPALARLKKLYNGDLAAVKQQISPFGVTFLDIVSEIVGSTKSVPNALTAWLPSWLRQAASPR
jgi:hypothetical protein